VRWAAQTGPATEGVVAQILERLIHPQQGYRACLGLLRLEKVHGAARLEAACARALATGAVSYKSVKSILQNKLDTIPTDQTPTLSLPRHGNVRGADYYKQDKDGPAVGQFDDPQAVLPFSYDYKKER
jgi:hypothetical protein